MRMDSGAKTWIEFVSMFNIDRPERRDGFPQETLYVVPRKLLHRARANPALHGLTVTDAGMFPNARFHLRRRESGCDEHIFIMCTEGTGFVSLPDRDVELVPGCAVTVPSGAPHEYGADRDNPWTIYWMHVVGDFVPVYIPHLQSGRAVEVPPECDDFVILLFQRIFSLLSRGTAESYLTTASAAAELILSSIYLGNRSSSDRTHAAGSHEVEDLIAYIQDHLEERITLEHLCSRSHLSVSRISQLFREMTGHAPIEFVQHQRVQRACYYLDATTEPIGYIAEQVGFEDQFYFSRVFRKVTGMPPREYRKSRSN